LKSKEERYKGLSPERVYFTEANEISNNKIFFDKITLNGFSIYLTFKVTQFE